MPEIKSEIKIKINIKIKIKINIKIKIKGGSLRIVGTVALVAV
ncbi:hypothetical protein KUA23_30105 [Pseudomonas pergaminensis]|uniref:Uncharacterized protein n=1 Tax=Pseudomonas pergaminensis TaxID=2853159 RepID=A0ABD8B3Z0_9PSED|nr:hypothetical protein [Pseudomonas pergaminensis]